MQTTKAPDQQTMVRTLALLTLVILLSACASSSDAPRRTPTEVNLPKSLRKKPPLYYRTVFMQAEFSVREAFLGKYDAWAFFDRTQRISGPTETMKVIPDNSPACVTPARGIYDCTSTIIINANQFQLTAHASPIGGDYELIKNGQSVWNDRLWGGTCTPIYSIKQIGNELAIGYLDVDEETYKATSSILLTEGNEAIDILKTTDFDSVSLPSELNGELSYFATKDSSGLFLVVGGKRVGEDYKSILNPCCCWDGPPMKLASNGEVIDFFAEKDDGWYHIQAGNLSVLH